MIGASAEGVVHAAPADVYALLTDPERMARLASNPVEVLEVRDVDGRRVTRTRTRLPNGATFDTERTLLESVPDRRLVVEGEIAPFGPAPTRRLRFGRAFARLERTLEPHPDGTLVSVRMQVRVSPPPLRLWFAVFKRGQWQRGADESLARLRDAF
jgi:uncharacterized protein YndB with AHSA1/START domain